MSFLFLDLAYFICFYSSQVNWSNGLSYTPTANSTLPACALSPAPHIAVSCQCGGLLFGLAPVLRVLPAWFRFAQCLRRYRDMKKKKLVPHVVNAGKYSTTFLSTACRAWFETSPGQVSLAFYIITSIIQSTYTYTWDIRMDWGLCECQTPNRLLRDETVYQYRAYYYVAIVENFILRFSWTFRVGFMVTMKDSTEYLNAILPTAEVIRRFIWNFFRLENEHLNNCGEFRAVRDIFIRPERRDSNQNHHAHPSHRPRRLHSSEPHNNTNNNHISHSAPPRNPQLRSVQSELVLEAMGRLWNWLSRKPDDQTTHDNSLRPPVIEIEMQEANAPKLVSSNNQLGGDPGARCDRTATETMKLDHGERPQFSAENPRVNNLHTFDTRRKREITKSAQSLHTFCLNHIEGGPPISGSTDQICLMRIESSPASMTTSSSKSRSLSWESGHSSMDAEAKGLNPTATSVTLLSETPDGMVGYSGSQYLLQPHSPIHMNCWQKNYGEHANVVPVNHGDAYYRCEQRLSPETAYPREITIPDQLISTRYEQLEAYENPSKKHR